ncbi:protein translocase subunit SecF [Sporanaerobium hydrogeniformans]|uniref:Protein translocase subunit SecF n=1 Tax=Sporanaerobium hydrogeniformans TaxID=3072179 RepID=A0AC61DF22_9FIRM|nr:protein translocase subunit SecF [Sporanaerobium hydrogeniformans]PHV71643.1 protein translocase subunit SecF [Sporanaerobium hydrogeniformans]
MKFIENKNKFFIASLVVIAIGLLTMCFNGFTGKGAFEQDIEFKGGSLIQVNIEQKLTGTIKEELVELTKEITGDANPRITAADNTDVIITMTRADADSRIKLFEAIKEKYNLKDDQARADSDVSPSISGEIKLGALKAVVLGAVLILIYISFRFKDFKFGASAVIALMHDVLIMLAVYSVFRIPLNNSFIAAMLTIVGYSINDTIIIFDRIRENKGKMITDHIDIINTSINQTLSRSIYTSLTTLIMIVLLFILGADSVKQFAFPLIIGIVAGTYSSIFIASPLWYIMSKSKKNKKKNGKPKTA